MRRTVAALAVLASAALPSAEAFAAPGLTALRSDGLARPAVCAAPALSLRGMGSTRHGAVLSMADSDTPTVDRSDENKEEEQEEVPDTVLSDDDLDARIAALGLGTEEGVADKSTGEDPMESMQTMDRVRKQAGDIGMKAVGGVASAAINVLNTLEEPISEEDYAKMMEEKEKNKVDKNMPMPEEERTMINQGGLAVAALPATVGALFMLWGLGGELGWF